MAKKTRDEFERSYTLEGTAGQHDPHVIRAIVARMVSVLSEAEK